MPKKDSKPKVASVRVRRTSRATPARSEVEINDPASSRDRIPAGVLDGRDACIDETSPGKSVVAIAAAFRQALRRRLPDSEARSEASFHLAEIVFDAYSLTGLVSQVMRGGRLSSRDADRLLFALCEHLPYHQRLLRKTLKASDADASKD